MTKKEYMKPAQTMVTLQHIQVLCVSQVSTTGLDEDLNYNKGTGDMESGAMTKENSGIWDDEW